MSKVIISPIARWPGTVTLADPLTLDQALAFEEAQDEASVYRDGLGDAGMLRPKDFTHLLKIWEPGLLACVECADLPALPAFPQHLPGSPGTDAKAFVVWLLGEVSRVYQGAEVPNA